MYVNVLNHITLRIAKTLWGLAYSECSMVMKKQNFSYRIGKYLALHARNKAYIYHVYGYFLCLGVFFAALDPEHNMNINFHGFSC